MEHQLGISGRQLERVFKKRVGLTPKDINKFIRINSALTTLKARPQTSLSELGYMLEYYDLPPFSKDFSQLTGFLPSKIGATLRNEVIVTHGKCFKL
ncbi:helix-turn-helix domain-containing protein [uncultured Pedobacter sp.]|uniref:helix-turn-helix domain-containing protein n=1 Tax=uncultured Pedobacter sp. TaxID=246139 RepID=UPI002603387F|nr:helix-turn-helix domain-containing protein [uncultured Pedobacter sp.]